MNTNDVLALVITGIIGLVIIVLSLVLLSGRGAFLVAGYNTMSKTEKAKYDSKALCKFIGKITLPVGILLPAIAFGAIYEIMWIPFAYIAAVVGLSIYAVIYANTGNHFKISD